MDTIYVLNEKNEKEKMEVVSIFDLSNKAYRYIIYKPLDKKEYYVGKFKGNNITSLDTNLDELELELSNAILKDLIGEDYDKGK
ncbi:MAG: hypothetical protein IJ565_05350 [Bacilli bacterium]|nr:hypothetical protein [Bacilli bacterium]